MRTKQAHPRPAVARVVNGLRRLPGFRSYPVLYLESTMSGLRHRAVLSDVRAFLLFVGHPRSGHSLVGSLLDAHPNVAISHELDALKYVAAGYRRTQLFALVLENAKSNAAAGRKSWGYSYAVPGQWQGRFQRLEVIGDKRGRMTTARLRDDPALFDRLQETVRTPVQVVHVVRNPYDNIATMYQRGRVPIDDQIDKYFSLCDTVDGLVEGLEPSAFHRLHLEDLVEEAKRELSALCAFVDVPAEAEYLDACAGIVFQSPRRTRGDAPWTPELLERVASRSVEHSWLSRYGFDS